MHERILLSEREDPLHGLSDFMGYRTSWVIWQIEKGVQCTIETCVKMMKTLQLQATTTRQNFLLCQSQITANVFYQQSTFFLTSHAIITISPKKKLIQQAPQRPREKRDKLHTNGLRKKKHRKKKTTTSAGRIQIASEFSFSFSSSLVAFGCGEKKQQQQQLPVNIFYTFRFGVPIKSFLLHKI